MEETFSDLISQVLLWRKRLPQPVARQLSRDILTLVPVRYQLSRWHFAIRLSPGTWLPCGRPLSLCSELSVWAIDPGIG